jgi:hypothetical protein
LENKEYESYERLRTDGIIFNDKGKEAEELEEK